MSSFAALMCANVYATDSLSASRPIAYCFMVCIALCSFALTLSLSSSSGLSEQLSGQELREQHLPLQLRRACQQQAGRARDPPLGGCRDCLQSSSSAFWGMQLRTCQMRAYMSSIAYLQDPASQSASLSTASGIILQKGGWPTSSRLSLSRCFLHMKLPT